MNNNGLSVLADDSVIHSTVSLNEARSKTMKEREREQGGMGQTSKSLTILSAPTTKIERERKIGHRRVAEDGQVTYKKKPTSELMSAIQLGIGQSIGGLSPKPKRDVLYGDFDVVETLFFPREGSNYTPAHRYSDFRFKTYAPIAFRYFRDLFEIQPDDFLLSLCNEPLQELSNPGASGSIFYITNDDEFIIKTVQRKEAEFLQKLLPGYYMNLNQNPRTLLPKFYGLYCYQCGGKNIRFVIMNNLLPSSITMHSKYDLKGSTFKRKASRSEMTKARPTYKDLDFREQHPDGLLLELDTYNALVKTMERDCRVLQSFKIMDYSMLIAIHNLDESARMKVQEPCTSQLMAESADGAANFVDRSRMKSTRQKIAQFSTAMEAIQATSDPLDSEDTDVPSGGIPARSSRGERLLLFMGIIDILQSYRFSKKLEHTFKSFVTDGDTISVHRPGFYAQRFQNFFSSAVFKKIPILNQPTLKSTRIRFKKLVQMALRHTPSKRKSWVDRQKSIVEAELQTGEKSFTADTDRGAVGGRPDVLPSSQTPLPPYTIRQPTLSFQLTDEDASRRDLQASSDESIRPQTTVSEITVHVSSSDLSNPTQTAVSDSTTYMADGSTEISAVTSVELHPTNDKPATNPNADQIDD